MNGFRKFLIALIFILALMIAASYGALVFVRNNLEVYGKSGSFTIQEGDYGRDVFNKLEDEGYIANSVVAYYYSKFQHPSDFKAGEFEIPADLDLNSLIDYLSNMDNIVYDTVNVTFIEGEWVKDLAQKIGEATNVEANDLLAYWSNADTIRNLSSQYEILKDTDSILGKDVRYALEGYFYPDTYQFYRETSVQEVTETLLDNAQRVYDGFKEDIAKSSYSTHELYTLASIVQYEAATAYDMNMVAGVLYNRLNDGMLLECSVTVCYSIDLEDKSQWWLCEYNPEYDSPYNTYMYAGLPPGPICSPGYDALYAVLNPIEHGYYFFIADVCGDGQVYYSENLAQHEAYIEEYLTCY